MLKGSVILPLFSGAATALITPFKNGKIDYVSMGKLIEWQISQGIDALVVCGTTGEASTLSPIEKVQLVKFAVDLTDKRIPVIAGVGSNSTQMTAELAEEMECAGADGLLVITPYYNKCTDIGLIAHYETVSNKLSVPVIMYSVPSRTAVNISPDVVKVLAEHPNIIGIKEASGNISQICEIAASISDDFCLYSGNDDQTVPIMSLGGIGCISTVSNLIPARYAGMIHDYLAGNCKAAGKEQVAIKPLVNAVFAEVNPIPVKSALAMMGMCEEEYRLPLCSPSNKTQYMLYDTMREFDLV